MRRAWGARLILVSVAASFAVAAAPPAAARPSDFSVGDGVITFLAGAGTLVLVGSLTFVVGLELGTESCSGDTCRLDPHPAALVVGLSAAPFLLAATIHSVGDGLGGRGALLPTLLGAALGALVPLAIGLATEDETLTLAVALIAPALGGTLGYALSDGDDEDVAAVALLMGKGSHLSLGVPGVGVAPTPGGGLRVGLALVALRF